MFAVMLTADGVSGIDPCHVLQGCSSDALSKTKTDYDSFLADPANLKAVKEQLKVQPASSAEHLTPCRTCRTAASNSSRELRARPATSAAWSHVPNLSLPDRAMQNVTGLVSKRLSPNNNTGSSCVVRRHVAESHEIKSPTACW